ncbi:unnamed protein product [Didymodactylos carnosus]|uniref:Uncharacterized protein n=1 Tax=Didymodactylos carnosus TaxID=1234261 RepID=A0A816ED24_9BILA|nr:unnamed protein product [Didymodactylos carnosus]CAF4565941.1 unnamed protein product [Didymodactylos carnosus]
MHYYNKVDDVKKIRPLLDAYRAEMLSVYGPRSELYSVHAHKYLPNQVEENGALFSTGCFGDESFLGVLKKFRKGNIRIPYQIFKSYLLRDLSYNEQQPLSLDDVFTKSKIYDTSYINKNIQATYMNDFKTTFNTLFQQTVDKNILYCRLNRGLVKFNSLLYSRIGSHLSNIISFETIHCKQQKRKCYGAVIWYFQYQFIDYAFIKAFLCTDDVIRSKRDDLLAGIAHEYIDHYYAVIDLSRFNFIVIPVKSILHQCMIIPFGDKYLLTEIFCTYEHD